MLKKVFAVIFVLLLCNLTAEAQRNYKTSQEDEKWTDRIVFGGGLGISFFNGWNINVSPNVGYKITDQFWAGIGLDYYYGSFRYDSENKDQFSIIGPKAFALYYITPQINLGTEFAYYDYTYTLTSGGRKTKTNEEQNSWLIGGGYTQRMGGRAGIRFEFFYDVLYDESNTFNFRNSAFVPRVNIVYGL